MVVIQEVFNLNLHYAKYILPRKIFTDISDDSYTAGEKKGENKSQTSAFVGILVVLSSTFLALQMRKRVPKRLCELPSV